MTTLKIIKNHQVVKWFRSLGFKGTIIFLSMAIWLVFGTVLVINTKGKELISIESVRYIEQVVTMRLQN